VRVLQKPTEAEGVRAKAKEGSMKARRSVEHGRCIKASEAVISTYTFWDPMKQYRKTRTVELIGPTQEYNDNLARSRFWYAASIKRVDPPAVIYRRKKRA
jgi:hypothetical protein